MKFTVTCLVSSVNSSLLAESEAVTKEITVANPRATVQNLRATVAIQFRLKVVAFEFRFDRREGATEGDSAAPSSSPSAGSAVVDFGDEKKLLTECGLQEGDHLKVVPKNYTSLRAAGAAAVAARETSPSEGPATKRVRIEASDEVEAPVFIASEDEDAEEESELDEEDDADDSEEDGDAKGQNDLFAALQEVVPDLTVLRQEFLANPQTVMERIERNHPSLFQVIVQNQETFVTLMNNEQLTKAAQGMLHGGTMGGDEDEDEEGSLEWSMGEEDEEMDEETAEQMSALFQSYITSAARSGDSGDFDAADLAELEASGMQVEEVDGGDGSASGSARIGKAKRQSDNEFILSRVPSEEDEKKIQALTELGFTYEQCKVAFYLCHRSIDRASNMLFEAPPEI
ncbi:conserved hypothetical protein [Leishmania mexicana MHOM/GT/2001/U1103]|uniref:UBA domain-containing protein n=1 Tax=Leishmania mexicana (strain MHOM/GT/2001/U1103) TaxID=929439 RepID=E9ALR5_LEIMU|nr:conserved hypothetical protein [Leishmania mexicana MHOM/GT/2001/U1103]CBZ23870.1 conserved hypothetical protein [Leishmania mexicana MHOM/GT/2001/U1103]